ncbi:MAG TPA: DUF3307 domain-containing protein [Cryomorphaceae bacterium]|nr:DUF3307 domain-containing protein [Cryomorphaceae bacterium]
MSALLIQMLLAHVLGDFVFQPKGWVKDKLKRRHKSKYLYLHILIHLAALMVVFQFDFAYWMVFLVIPISHLAIDLVKINLNNRVNLRWLFALDQLAHLLVIAVLAFYYFPDFSLSGKLFSEANLFLLLCILLLTAAGSVLIQILMSRWIVAEDKENQSLPAAGKYIGMLERLFIFAFVLLNQWSAIGFLITAKSVFRFGDLSRAKDRKLTEYILIGTLLSFGLAILTGLIYLYISVRLSGFSKL